MTIIIYLRHNSSVVLAQGELQFTMTNKIDRFDRSRPFSVFFKSLFSVIKHLTFEALNENNRQKYR